MSQKELSRRHLLVGSAALGAVTLGNRALAQDATPETEVDDSVQVAATPVAAGPVVPPEMEQTEGNWVTENANYVATRVAEGSSISSSNIAEMGVAWKMTLDVSGGYGAMTAAPLVLNDVVFVQDMQSNVTALDKESGDVIWRNEYSVATVGPNGLALGYGYLVFPLGDTAEVVAVEQETGEEAWRVQLSNNMGEGVDMAPLIHDNTVYVSTVPGNTNVFYRGGQKGIIYALDITSGRTIWQFDTTTDNLWGNARVNSGGGLWHPPSIDDEGKLYVGVGNAAPWPGNKEYPNGTSRPGDNDYANSLVKLDPKTGSVEWYINVKPFDLFDLDNQLTPVLAEVEGRPVVFTSGKHGYVVAADQETGEEIWRTAVGMHQNDDLTELPADEYIEVFPGSLGGVETPIAYSEGVIFAPILNSATWYNSSSTDPSLSSFAEGTGQLVALDAASGEILWDVSQPTATFGAATVANDLVFTGGLDGVVRAYNVSDGTQVWTYQASSGLNAPFTIAGDYLFIPAGGAFIASEDTWDPAPEPVNELIALKIGGEVQVAPEGAAASPAAEEATPEAAAADSGSAINVAAIDIGFDPKELSMAADSDVTISVANNGVLQHDFVIEGTDFATPLLNGGESGDLVVNLPAGEYIYFCSVPGHREAGMQGTLTVG